MGVPLTRHALKGSWQKYSSGGGFNTNHELNYLGDPLTSRVAHFIAIVGPNYGVLNCTDYAFSTSFYRGCDHHVGYYPGSFPGMPFPADMST